MNDASIARVRETFEAWAMYDAVVRNDYMHHAEITGRLAAWAAAIDQPLRIVDLGCGDAWLATTAFADAEVADYLGIDVSESAADQAARNLARWSDRARVECGNFAEKLKELPSESASVVLGSFSIHHFSSDAKREILHECARILAQGGSLLWIDAVRREDQERDVWVRELADMMQREWTGLSPDQRASACTHVLESDFPETANEMDAMTQAAGFERGEPLLRRKFFSGWVFRKTGLPVE